MDKRKYDKEGYCSRCGKQSGFSIVMGLCGHPHEVCTLCKCEWCTQFHEYEQLSNYPSKPLKDRAHLSAERKGRKPRPSTKGNGKQSREKVFEQIICEAEGHLGDLMGEYAEGEYEEKGGSVGMVEGRFSLKKDEIRECMFEALYYLTMKIRGKTKIDLDAMRIDREKLVNYWYRRDYK